MPKNWHNHLTTAISFSWHARVVAASHYILGAPDRWVREGRRQVIDLPYSLKR